MIDLAAVQNAFSELKNVKPLVVAASGQKDVLEGEFNGERVVLKVIKADPSDERIQREIAAVAKLKSSYVPKVLGQGQRVIGGAVRVFVIEEFISGQPYRSVLDTTQVQPLVSVVRLMDVLLLACRDFETQKVVHRDMKPANLMIDANGKVWVIDFGICRMLDEPSITPSAQRFGPFSLGYAAPEQMRNQKTQVNVRADLFSVGVIAYESLAGVNPYFVGKKSPVEVLDHMLNRDLPRLTVAGDVNGEVASFLAALTARFPSRRPQSSDEAIVWFQPIRVRYIGAPAQP